METFSYPPGFDNVCAENVVQTVDPNNNALVPYQSNNNNNNTNNSNNNINNNQNNNQSSNIELYGTYNVYTLQGSGVHGVRNVLRSNENGSQIDLWYEDDKSGRQQWHISKQLNSNTFNIKIQNGVTGLSKYLSCNEDGTIINLSPNDDYSGRQQWIIQKIAQTKNGLSIFNVCVSKGVASNRRYLSAKKDGNVDLWYTDESTGRQQWIFEKLQINDIVNQSNAIANPNPNMIYNLSSQIQSNINNPNYITPQAPIIPQIPPPFDPSEYPGLAAYALPDKNFIQIQQPSSAGTKQGIDYNNLDDSSIIQLQPGALLHDNGNNNNNINNNDSEYVYIANMNGQSSNNNKFDASQSYIIPNGNDNNNNNNNNNNYHLMGNGIDENDFVYQAKVIGKPKKLSEKFRDPPKLRIFKRTQTYSDVGDLYANDYTYGIADTSKFAYTAKDFQVQQNKKFPLFKV